MRQLADSPLYSFADCNKSSGILAHFPLRWTSLVDVLKKVTAPVLHTRGRAEAVMRVMEKIFYSDPLRGMYFHPCRRFLTDSKDYSPRKVLAIQGRQNASLSTPQQPQFFGVFLHAFNAQGKYLCPLQPQHFSANTDAVTAHGGGKAFILKLFRHA